MGKFDWRAMVSSIAPTLATAFGGPLAGAATAAVAKAVLGREDAPESEIEAALARATPEQLGAVRAADQAFAVRMRELDLDLDKLVIADRADARQREIKTTDSWTPRLLAVVVVVSWGVIQWHILNYVVPAEMRELAARALGTLDMALGMVLGYYFGTSAGSREKTVLMAKAAAAQESP